MNFHEGIVVGSVAFREHLIHGKTLIVTEDVDVAIVVVMGHGRSIPTVNIHIPAVMAIVRGHWLHFNIMSMHGRGVGHRRSA